METVHHRSGDIVRRPRPASTLGNLDAFLARCQPAIERSRIAARKIAHDARRDRAARLLARVTDGEISLEAWLNASGNGRGDKHTARVVGRYLRRMAWIDHLISEAA
jgi:hypothetical protein